MKKLLIGILLTFTTLALAREIDINKAKGTEQSVILLLTPIPANMDVDQDVMLTAKFDVELDAKHVQKNNLKLKYITQTKESMIDGEIVYDVHENAVTFKPHTLLADGYYEVAFKSLKATKSNKSQQIKEIKYRFYVPEVINGHKLPPEPNETLNNSTLLGIDVNNNGVRDDVERKIIIKYQKPIEIEVMMRFAKIDQETLASPLSEALLLERKASKLGDCKMFLRRQGIKINRAIKYSEDFTYNTRERTKKYIEYNKVLSGGVYGSSPSNYKAESCDFDVEQMLKDRK